MSSQPRLWTLLARDMPALAGAVFLTLLVVVAIVGPLVLGDLSTHVDLRLRNVPPFSLEHGWSYLLGADALGRSVAARIVVGARNSLAIAVAAVATSAVLGGLLGLVAGFKGGRADHLIMRLADIVMSFPSLLLALVVIYLIGPSGYNIVVVLAIAGIPIYLRTVRAEVLEVRERMFVSAARALGVKPWRILIRHILPMVMPTLLTLATLEFASVILTESALSFLGLGIQPPDFTWGAMVASGRAYLASAWWIACLPGVMIMLTTLALNLVSSWLKTATDPQQRWRLEIPKQAWRDA